MAENVLKKVSADERMKEMQRSIEMAEMDQQVRMEYARGQGFEKGHEEGHEEGHEQGLEQGREEGIVALLSTLRKMGVTRDVAKKELISNYRLEDAEAERWMTKFWE